MVIGMHDDYPHKVIGTKQNENSLGDLESNIYRDTGIRPEVYELFEDEANKTGRVVVIEVPSRPIGKVYKFEDVALMRVGADLLPMDDKVLLSILQEQEPDFSAKICEGLTMDDLDPEAIKVMKQKYAEKNENPGFESFADEQALSDLELLVEGKLNYAALILLGKSKAIRKYLPQNNVVIEYRKDPASIQYDERQEIQEPLFLAIDSIWAYVKQPSLNPQMHVSSDAYIMDVRKFTQATVREAVLNAITHRSMIVQNDVVVKMSPSELTITNAGGFPVGVDKSNVLTVNSTPRSKRLAEVLQKTGLVEKSGQGVDKMFTNCIMEAKALPDYSATDDYQVSLTLRSEIRDVAFMRYIRQEQAKRPENHKLNVFQLLAIYETCFKDGFDVSESVIDGLVTEGILVRSKTGKISLGKDYKRIERETKTKSGPVNGGVNGGVNGPVNGPVNALSDSLKQAYLTVYDNQGLNLTQISALLKKPVTTVKKQLTTLRKMGLIEHRDSDKTGGYYPV